MHLKYNDTLTKLKVKETPLYSAFQGSKPQLLHWIVDNEMYCFQPSQHCQTGVGQKGQRKLITDSFKFYTSKMKVQENECAVYLNGCSPHWVFRISHIQINSMDCVSQPGSRLVQESANVAKEFKVSDNIEQI